MLANQAPDKCRADDQAPYQYHAEACLLSELLFHYDILIYETHKSSHERSQIRCAC